MGRVGMQRVSESLAWEHSVPPLLAAYAALAKEPARHGMGDRMALKPTVSVVFLATTMVTYCPIAFGAC